MNKPLLTLLCVVGLTVAPKAQAFAGAETVITTAVVYEIISLFRTWTRDPKPDKTQRPLLEYSFKLFKKDKKQWISNAYQNAWIIQEDYVEGQGFKDTYLKLSNGDKIKASKRKCYHFGINGWLLFYLAFLDKTKKSVKDLALLVFAFGSLKGGLPKALEGNKALKPIFDYFGWTNGSSHPNTAWTVTPQQLAAMPQATRNDIINELAH